MTITFLDLRPPPALQAELDAAYRRVMASGWYILGTEVEAFEQAFAAYCGAGHCVGVGSGFDALHLILRAYGIGAGDDVIVPANTYIATWLAVSHTGAQVVPVEPDLHAVTLDPTRVAAAVTPRTRAIIAVHLYGQTADMAPLRNVAQRHGIRLIEDAAQAHGARYRGARAGSLADAAGWSFYPGKNLGAYGDAGAVTTDDADLARRLRVLRNYGSERKYAHVLSGVNSRLDTLQAAFLAVKLPHLDAGNDRRRALASQYLEGLAGVPGLMLPVVPAWADPVWHLFVVRHPRRDALQEHLRRAGIETLIHYPVPPHLSPAYASLGWQRGAFAITEHLAASVLSLPVGPHLDTDAVRYVIDTVRSFPSGPTAHP